MTTVNTLRSDQQTPVKVTPFEDKLLRNTRLILQSTEPATQNWYYHSPPQHYLSENAATLLKKMLAQGTVLFLVEVNQGWSESFLRQGQEKIGRLWERYPLTERTLHFSTNILDMLFWLTSADPSNPNEWTEPQTDPARSTPADEFVVWRIADWVQSIHTFRSNSFKRLCSLSVFRSNSWLWLCTPYLLETGLSIESVSLLDKSPWYARARLIHGPSFSPCFQGLRSIILEALQNLLFQRLINTFPIINSDIVSDTRDFVCRNVTTYLVYRQFLLEAEQAGRPDLALFLLRVLAKLIPAFPQAQNWWEHNEKVNIGQLNTMQERIEAWQAAVALPLLINILHRWTQHYRSVGYWDEEYHTAQWWLRQWERYRGDELVDCVNGFMHAIPIPSTNQCGTGYNERM
jgi:hypothetical protein